MQFNQKKNSAKVIFNGWFKSSIWYYRLWLSIKLLSFAEIRNTNELKHDLVQVLICYLVQVLTFKTQNGKSHIVTFLPKTLHNLIDYLQHSSLRIYFTRNHDCNVQCHFELSFPPPKILLLSGVINRHCEEPPNCNCLPVRQEWNRKFKLKQQCGLRERPGPQLLDAKSLLLSYWVKLKAQKWNYLLSICFFYY